MPSLANKALLCELEVFAADNNIRRAILLATSNNQSPNNSITDFSTTIAGSGSQTVPVLSTNSMTIIKTTGGPMGVTLQFGSPADVLTLPTVTFTISNLLVLSTQVASLSFANAGSTSVQLRVIQV
jgi:hypothetical protein